MTDKVQKIREEIEKLHKEYRNKKGAFYYRKALRTVLFLIDTLQEESIYTDFTKALAECIHQAQCSVFDPLVHAEIWKDELIKLAKSEEPVSEQNLSNVQRTGKNWKEEQFEKNRLKH